MSFHKLFEKSVFSSICLRIFQFVCVYRPYCLTVCSKIVSIFRNCTATKFFGNVNFLEIVKTPSPVAQSPNPDVLKTEESAENQIEPEYSDDVSTPNPPFQHLR